VLAPVLGVLPSVPGRQNRVRPAVAGVGPVPAAPVTGPLAEARADLETWLPVAAALIAEPDTDTSAVHGKPGSRPPWNTQVAAAILDVHAAVRHLEAGLHAEVTGRPRRPRGGSDGNTLAAIQAIGDLATNASRDSIRDAERTLVRLVAPLRLLRAIDLDERFIKVRARCPYCELPMLRLGERSGRVACLRYGSCYDRNGDHPVGFITRSVSGEAFIAWADGFNQYATITSEETPAP
jgi:hypothetical protein